MGIQLEVDPARLKSLRTRLEMPRHAGAERARVSEAQLTAWESEPTSLPVETLQQLARAYNRNWYVFLLEDGVGRPAVPRDFRKHRGAATKLSVDSLLAFDNASLLLDKIESLSPSVDPMINGQHAQLSDDPEIVAENFREVLGVVGEPDTPDSYATLRFWVDLLTSGGIYISQVPMPTDEVRAFCLSRDDNHLIVLSNSDWATARTFSLIHEVGHLLLGTDAMCRPDEALLGQPSSHEPWCNRFAAAVLMPKSVLEENPKFQRLIEGEIKLGSGRSLARDFGVSELALFRRLETFGYLSGSEYQKLQDESDQQWKDRSSKKSGGFLVYPKKIIAKESPLFVRQVFDAYSKGDIPYREIGTLLGTPLRSIPQIREAVG